MNPPARGLRILSRRMSRSCTVRTTISSCPCVECRTSASGLVNAVNQTPPTRPSCSIELLIAPTEKSWYGEPFTVLDVEQSDTEPLMAHLGHISRDVTGCPRCLHTGRRVVLLTKLASGRPIAKRQRRKGNMRESRYQQARRSHHQSRRTDLRRATPEVEVRKLLAPVQCL